MWLWNRMLNCKLGDDCGEYIRKTSRQHGQWLSGFPTLVKYTVRTIDNRMANWKVIETVSGNIEAVSGPPAECRPGQHEFLVWEGPAADKAEAIQNIHPELWALTQKR